MCSRKGGKIGCENDRLASGVLFANRDRIEAAGTMRLKTMSEDYRLFQFYKIAVILKSDHSSYPSALRMGLIYV